MRQQRPLRVVKIWPMVVVLAVFAGRAGWLRGEPLSPDQAKAARVAIEHDLKSEFPRLCALAADRAHLRREDLRGRRVACVIAATDVRFESPDRATYTISYSCGIAPWQPAHGHVVATPSIPLGLIKEHGSWGINAFL